MSKAVVIITRSNNNTGKTTEKVLESENGQGPAPVRTLGYYVGTVHTFSMKGKKVQNRELHKAGFTRSTQGENENGEFVSLWTHANGAMVMMTRTDNGYTFERVS